MLVEVHIIQNHAPSNLNRDDSGSPKSAIFGGYRRARISSQCLKRCYRTSKTFRDEVDNDLGMHTRSMPDEIKRRLLAHAESMTNLILKAKCVEWADKSQAKLSAMLGKGAGNIAEAEESEGQDNLVASDAQTEAGNGYPDRDDESDSAMVKQDKYQTAQSIFWRETELKALFEAYRDRIEWDTEIPDQMHNAFDGKGRVRTNDILKCLDCELPKGKLGEIIKGIKVKRDASTNELDMKHKPPENESADAKKRREKRLKEAKARVDQNAAQALQQLILKQFDPKLVLKEAGLRPEGTPVDMALFGRMIASPLMHNVEASSQFAHAISTHEWTREFDMWTRVDDRRDRRLDFYLDAFGAEEKLESGTDGMGDAEFTSACYYSYFNVDFDALVDNLTGKALKHDLDDPHDRENARHRAGNAVIGLIKAAIFERPSGKFNSMATPSLPTLVLVEIRDTHVPVSYADAFSKPVDPINEEKQNDIGQIERVDLCIESANRLIDQANRITNAFRRAAKMRLEFKVENRIKDLEGWPRDPEGAFQAPTKVVANIDELVMEIMKAIDCLEVRKNA